MSDNIIDFNKRKKEQLESQPLIEVPMESLLNSLISRPQNDLLADVARSVHEKLTRLLILTDIASKASDMLSAYGFDPDNFCLEENSLNRFLSGIMDEGEDALWNGPFFDWEADDENNSTVRVVTTIRTEEEEEDDLAVRLALELMKLGEDDDTWWRFNDGEWVHDGPPGDMFDSLVPIGYDDDDWDDDEDDDWDDDEDDDWEEEEWFDDDEDSIYNYDFGPVALKALTLAGIETVEQLKALSDDELEAVNGMDAKSVSRVKKILSYIDDDDEDEDEPF